MKFKLAIIYQIGFSAFQTYFEIISLLLKRTIF